MHANMAFLKWSQKAVKTLTELGLVFVKKKEGNKIKFLIFCLQCSRKIRIFVTGNEIENIISVLIPFNAHKLLGKSKLSTTKYTNAINNYDSG